jgi:hypothetical protein
LSEVVIVSGFGCVRLLLAAAFVIADEVVEDDEQYDEGAHACAVFIDLVLHCCYMGINIVI